MKRWIAILLGLLMGMLPSGGGAESTGIFAQEAPPAIADAAWQGHTIARWLTDKENPDAAMAVLQAGETNVLCLLAREGDEWRVLAHNDAMLRPGELTAGNPDLLDLAEGLLGYSYHDDSVGFWDETCAVACVDESDPAAWFVTEYSRMDADRIRYGMQYLTGDGLIEVRAESVIDERGINDRALVADTIDCSVASFDPEAAVTFMQEAIAGRMGPPAIPYAGSADALPEPQLVDFAGGKKYDVYAGPGRAYGRAGESGKATVSTSDWIQVFGREGDWLLIQYRVDEINCRFGYIAASALPRGVQVPELAFARREAVSKGMAWTTEDPLFNQSETGTLQTGEHVTLLASLGEGWSYIERMNGAGQPNARGFVQTIAIVPMADYADKAVAQAADGSGRITLYENPEGARIAGACNDGVLLEIAAQGDPFTAVHFGGDRAEYVAYARSADLAFGAVPTDVRISLPRVESFSKAGTKAIPLYRLPDQSTAFASDLFEGMELEAMAEIGVYTLVRMPYDQEAIGFVRTDYLLPLPEALLGEEALAYVGPSRLEVRQGPSEDAAVWLSLLEGAVVVVRSDAEGWSLIRDVEGGRQVSGYVRSEALVRIDSREQGPQTLQLAELRLPEGQMQLLDMPSDEGAYVSPQISGARMLILGEHDGWYWVKMGAWQGFLRSEYAMLTGVQRGFTVSLYRGHAALAAAPGETEAMLSQQPQEEMATIWSGAPGTIVWLVAEQDGWWQVDIDGGYASGFVPAEQLADIQMTP